MNILAKRFLENCFHDVWILASLENIDRYYSKKVTGIFDDEAVSRKDIEDQCAWCKENEKITKVNFPEVIAEGNKIAFRVQLIFTDPLGQEKKAENMMIYHLDSDGRINKIWKKSSEKFSE